MCMLQKMPNSQIAMIHTIHMHAGGYFNHKEYHADTDGKEADPASDRVLLVLIIMQTYGISLQARDDC